ncbi:MAG: DUF2007 domain-containing protein [Bernardetiaceae bacterium]|nr:DUF2007 domain-containing protein [Bernardetiaceae bacterium]
MVTVKTYNNAMEAHLGRVMLEQAQIQAVVFNEESILINPFYNTTIGVRLNVREEDAERAREILAQEGSKEQDANHS